MTSTDTTTVNANNINYTELARQKFSADKFATESTGIFIEHADTNYSKCSFAINANHMNANNQVMGGAIFTLADFTFAIASNIGNPPTVTLNSRIDFLGTVKGSKLIAESTCIKSGSTMCVFDINVTDDLGNKVAKMTATGYRAK